MLRWMAFRSTPINGLGKGIPGHTSRAWYHVQARHFCLHHARRER